MNHTRHHRNGRPLACAALLLLGAGLRAAATPAPPKEDPDPSPAAAAALYREEKATRRVSDARQSQALAEARARLRSAPASGRREAQLAVADAEGEWGAALELGQPAAALRHFEAAYAIDRALRPIGGGGEGGGTDGPAAFDLDHIARCAERAGHYARARDAYRQLRADYKRAGGASGERDASAGLGLALLDLKRPADALPLLLHGLPLSRNDEPEYEIKTQLGEIGRAYMLLHRPAEALPFYRQALAICRDLTYGGEDVGAALGDLGEAYAALHQPAQALGFYRQALPLLRHRDAGANLARVRADIRAAQRQSEGH